MVFGGERAAGLPYNDELTKVYRTAIMVFRMSLIDEYPFHVRVYMQSNRANYILISDLYMCRHLKKLMN